MIEIKKKVKTNNNTAAKTVSSFFFQVLLLDTKNLSLRMTEKNAQIRFILLTAVLHFRDVNMVSDRLISKKHSRSCPLTVQL